MLKIYHNPRCAKSREGLAILEASGKEFEIIKYLDNPPSYIQLSAIIGKLGIPAIDLVRTNEKVWKENYKGKELSEKDTIQAMVDDPKLIERPILIHNNEAIVGRPPEQFRKLLQEN
ncbi:arsenate reductase (glutaredoxin) [Flavimarina sp. Hel_I_48]|uniref:arsenate reductase (glutaredoxin) n=1 Tax=Flavimarina sp. Hel_I_48 TaxID=1392488 RepID=UPI0004DFA8F5|nr:arsenate reductase (glutaredoxin) [Flavimarina sp. Hel_I_48]